MGLSRQLVIFGIVIGGYQLIQSRSRGKDLEEYYNLKYGAESAGEKVRNRLQGSDVGPQDEMLEDPSIYRDWAMVQKGYQSLRMMNDNDNFDAESFSSEWHYFSECETKGCDGDIEYRDVYACPSCGQDDVEILLGDTCPDCGETAEDVSKYAIFYCSDCEEDYTDMYNSEEGFDAESFAADARELYKTDPKELLELAKNEGLECVYCEGSSFHDPFATPYSKATGGATIYYPCDCGETQVVITDKKWGAESFAAEWLSRPIYNSCKNPNCDEMVVYHKEADIGKNCDKCIAITLYGKNQVCSVCKVKPIWDEGTDLCEGCSNNPELHNAESFSADSQTRVYRNLGIGAALVAGLAYWIKR